jgi:hypothetical protein
VNNLFREGGEFRRVFASSQYLSFDEFGPDVFYVHLKRPEEVTACAPDNISVIAFKKALAGELRVYTRQLGKENLGHREALEYRDGRVLNARTGDEYLFYHWVLEKRGIWFRYPPWLADRPSRFFVSTTGFYSRREFRIFPLIHGWRLLAGSMRWCALKASNYLRRRAGVPVTLDTYPRVGWVKRLDHTLS